MRWGRSRSTRRDSTRRRARRTGRSRSAPGAGPGHRRGAPRSRGPPTSPRRPSSRPARVLRRARIGLVGHRVDLVDQPRLFPPRRILEELRAGSVGIPDRRRGKGAAGPSLADRRGDLGTSRRPRDGGTRPGLGALLRGEAGLLPVEAERGGIVRDVLPAGRIALEEPDVIELEAIDGIAAGDVGDDGHDMRPHLREAGVEEGVVPAEDLRLRPDRS